LGGLRFPTNCGGKNSRLALVAPKSHQPGKNVPGCGRSGGKAALPWVITLNTYDGVLCRENANGVNMEKGGQRRPNPGFLFVSLYMLSGANCSGGGNARFEPQGH